MDGRWISQVSNHPLAVDGYAHDMGAMQWRTHAFSSCRGTVCTLNLVMAGAGKRTIVLTRRRRTGIDGEDGDQICVSLDEVRAFLGFCVPATAAQAANKKRDSAVSFDAWADRLADHVGKRYDSSNADHVRRMFACRKCGAEARHRQDTGKRFVDVLRRSRLRVQPRVSDACVQALREAGRSRLVCRLTQRSDASWTLPTYCAGWRR